MNMVAQQVTSPVPNFDDVVGALLEFIGVHPVLVAAVLLAFALESWYSNGRRMARAASVASGAVTRGSTWLVTQRPVRIFVTVATTVTVAIAQLLMIRVSYVGGSIMATPFDPVRWKALDNAYGISPLLFVDPDFLAQFLVVDMISVAYVLVTLFLMLAAYRKSARTTTLWFVATTPYWLFLFGSLAWAVVSVGFDLLFFAFHGFGADPYDWPLTTEYVISAPHLAVDLVSGVYCGMALVAIGGAGVVRRLWTSTAERGN